MTAEETAALMPVREALLDRARADADRTLSEARADARRALEEAERAATQIREQASDQGEAQGTEAAVAERARARRLVRAAELRARSRAYQRLRAQVAAELRKLRADPDYPRLLERMADEARRALGEDATITTAPEGGVLAEGAGVRADYSLDAFADRAVAALGPDVEGLWAP
ncbi:hypothetical protein HFP15_39095 [Amycolatopsis sp. K13G38]|uniref:V-type ATP synthase subunit E n=1 Tax=Amycolatopsis acididurans TaxID=2724524 RepID=A0ABX1JKS9_9PSEU|nr:V-type ATP synthase subunit E [Amycolatopsis acididurans]NKQ58867.1 hypothetical protein [Amycolatopsis acididurans]